jgi:hypothetical protein
MVELFHFTPSSSASTVLMPLSGTEEVGAEVVGVAMALSIVNMVAT